MPSSTRLRQLSDTETRDAPNLRAQRPYCCPLCKGKLHSAETGFCCPACRRDYPVICGIPDFRVFPDPYIGYEDDRRKGLRIAEHYAEKDCRGLIEYYWSISPETPSHLARRFVRHAMAGTERGRHWLAVIHEAHPPPTAQPAGRMLELGCRTGGFLVAAAEQFEQVVGIDIAFRWLVVAKKRLAERGLPAQLVCCCAEFLPFPEMSFDLVVAENVIEHTARQEQLIREAQRALKPGGVFFALTCNRYSLGLEPHVRLWGVGWLPRRWMAPYARWVGGVIYEHIRLVSFFELKRMIRRTSFGRGRMEPPTFSQAEQQRLSTLERRLIALYHKIKGWPLVRAMLLVVGPVLQLTWVRDRDQQHGCARTAHR